MITPRLLTLEQAADYLQVPMTEVRREAIGRVMFGTKARYDRTALDAWLDARQGGVAISRPPPQDEAEDALARTRQRLEDASRRP